MSSLDTDTFAVKYSEIHDKLISKNIFLHYLINRKDTDPDQVVVVNNDIEIEGFNNIWAATDRLCSMGMHSYSNSSFGYGVKIGRYCSIAPGVSVMGAHHYPDWISTSHVFYNNGFHELTPQEVSDTNRRSRKIEIGHDVWIGANVVLKSNIRIGNGAIVAANSVLTKDVPPFTIVGGNPARVIRSRFNAQVLEKIQNLQWWNYHPSDFVGLKANDPEAFVGELSDRISTGLVIERPVETIKKEFLIA